MPALTRVSVLLAALVLSLAPAAFAQYKVVGPDGRVTYTDRPPVGANAKVSSIGRSAAPDAPAAAGDTNLPFELRNIAARYPVTLYTTAECSVCESARQMLQQRGVPYRERRIVTRADSDELERRVGGRTIPALSVGAQPLRGFAPADWASYLDAAGYPRESRLPRGWRPPPATPLVETAAAPATAPAEPTPEPLPPPAPVPSSEPDSPSPIRF